MKRSLDVSEQFTTSSSLIHHRYPFPTILLRDIQKSNTSCNPGNNSPHKNYPRAQHRWANRNLWSDGEEKLYYLSDISTQFASILSINNFLHDIQHGMKQELSFVKRSAWKVVECLGELSSGQVIRRSCS